MLSKQEERRRKRAEQHSNLGKGKYSSPEFSEEPNPCVLWSQESEKKDLKAGPGF